jgi:hypothetical protein
MFWREFSPVGKTEAVNVEVSEVMQMRGIVRAEVSVSRAAPVAGGSDGVAESLRFSAAGW